MNCLFIICCPIYTYVFIAYLCIIDCLYIYPFLFEMDENYNCDCGQAIYRANRIQPVQCMYGRTINLLLPNIHNISGWAGCRLHAWLGDVFPYQWSLSCCWDRLRGWMRFVLTGSSLCVFSKGRRLHERKRNLAYELLAFSHCVWHLQAKLALPIDVFQPLLPVLLISADLLSSPLVEWIPEVSWDANHSQSICLNWEFLSTGCTCALPVSKAAPSSGRRLTWSVALCYLMVPAYVHPPSLVYTDICIWKCSCLLHMHMPLDIFGM